MNKELRDAFLDGCIRLVRKQVQSMQGAVDEAKPRNRDAGAKPSDARDNGSPVKSRARFDHLSGAWLGADGVPANAGGMKAMEMQPRQLLDAMNDALRK